MIYKLHIKRILDFVIALLLLTIFSPLILFTFFLLFISNNGDALFFQRRPGYKCKPFNILKFKTMRDALDSEGKSLPDEVRLTKIGKLVRAYSVDELLQLINVIKGEMSLVGPRPLLMQYLSRYTPQQLRRHDVRPGITGWAQVNGRNQLSWEDKFKFDIEYIENISFAMDVKILFLTLIKVILRIGINADGKATMDEFKG